MIEIKELTFHEIPEEAEIQGGAICGIGTCGGIACGASCPISAGSGCGFGCSK